MTVFPTCLLAPEKVELCTKVSKLFDMLNFEIINAFLSKFSSKELGSYPVTFFFFHPN